MALTAFENFLSKFTYFQEILKTRFCENKTTRNLYFISVAYLKIKLVQSWQSFDRQILKISNLCSRSFSQKATANHLKLNFFNK